MTSTFRGIGVQEYPNSLRERAAPRQLDLGPVERRRSSLTALALERHREKSQFECTSPLDQGFAQLSCVRYAGQSTQTATRNGAARRAKSRFARVDLTYIVYAQTAR